MTSKLAADEMLGGLAKWLRLLGFDTLYLKKGPFPPHRDRTLLTRRTTRPHQPRLTGWPRIIRLSANDTQGQLRECLRQLNLRPEDTSPLTRCSRCNEILTPLDPDQAAGLVPPYVLGTQTNFAYCPSCRKIYWAATHCERMAEVIKSLWPDLDDGRGHG